MADISGLAVNQEVEAELSEEHLASSFTGRLDRFLKVRKLDQPGLEPNEGAPVSLVSMEDGTVQGHNALS